MTSVEPRDLLIERAFARITGSHQHRGNQARLLRNADENYPAWLQAIREAHTSIYFENYIVDDDEVGQKFAAALKERAQAGVRVRVLYDWFGCLGRASSRYWADLAGAGVEVRAFNPPSVMAPLAWLRRDHRKLLVADDRIGFVSGLCVARDWCGDPARAVEPWRDTGVELRGPVVADLVRAFAGTWAEAGPPLAASDLPNADAIPAVGTVTARIIVGRPGTLSTYRLDQFVASAARSTLWLTDAYFVATTPYVLALTGAARDGVDVRLLVPRASDIPALKPITRAGYRPLIEAGVRVFEWNGPMLHAKTAVADATWARIGSTNLNVASWLANWELDVTITDAGFAGTMHEMYLDDLSHATEIVLDTRQGVRALDPRRRRRRSRKGSASRFAAGAIGLGNSAGAAITAARSLAATESKSIASLGVALVAVAAVLAFVPRLLAVPVTVVLAWIGVSLLARAWRLRHGRQDPEGAAPGATSSASGSRPASRPPQAPSPTRRSGRGGRPRNPPAAAGDPTRRA